MPSMSTRIAQTTSEVKKQYRKNGPGISAQQHKNLLRGHELDERAARLREAESRRHAAKEKRAERLQKEEAARRQIGVGLATQLAGYSRTQVQLKSGMEAFLGVAKRKEDAKRAREECAKRVREQEDAKRAREEELAMQLEMISQITEKEAWDDDGAEDGLLDLPEDAVAEELWADDDLDDDTLLEAHELVMSDPVEEPMSALHPPPDPLPVPAAISVLPPATTSTTIPMAAPKSAIPAIPAPGSAKVPVIPTPATATIPPTPANDEVAFARLHGPINKAIETVLDSISAPLVQLLSQDCSMRLPEWDPPVSLLHKLSPVGLPPHRLRVKVGCVVTLLRDLNTSSQLSKSQYLRVLRAGNERIECQVLDGQLEGAKTFITQVPFTSKYRNEEGCPFRRIQFPIRIATDYISPNAPQDVPQSGFKLPIKIGQLYHTVPRRTLPPPAKPFPRSNLNPSFKLPGFPASKAQPTPLKPIPSPNTSTSTTLLGLDGWDDFLESGTQIARELSAETKLVLAPSKLVTNTTPVADCVPPLSTQDLDFSLDDLEEESQTRLATPKVVEAVRPMKMPATVPPGLLSRAAQLRRSAFASVHKRVPPPQLKRKPESLPPTNMLQPVKKPSVHPACPAPQISPAPVVRARSFFSEFGLSTQDAASFFDDNDSDDDVDLVSFV